MRGVACLHAPSALILYHTALYPGITAPQTSSQFLTVYVRQGGLLYFL